jgi:hypothetical protein
MRELYARPEYIFEAQADWRTKGVEVRNRGRQPRRIIPSDVTLHHYRATLNATFADNRRLHDDQVPTRPRPPGTSRHWNRTKPRARRPAPCRRSSRDRMIRRYA